MKAGIKQSPSACYCRFVRTSLACLPLRRESIGSKLNDIDQCIFAQMTNACCPVSHLLTQLPPGRNNNIRTFTRRQISVVGGGLYFAGSMNASVCII